MDDDKNIIEKAIEAVKDIAHVASEAAKHAMEPEPIKPGDEVVMMPSEGSGLLGEPTPPQFVIIPRKRRRTRKTSKKTAKKTAKKETKKTVKKSAKTKSVAKKKKAKTRTVKKKKKVKRG